MIFFDYCLIDCSIPKELAPLADCMKKHQGVLVADKKHSTRLLKNWRKNFVLYQRLKKDSFSTLAKVLSELFLFIETTL